MKVFPKLKVGAPAICALIGVVAEANAGSGSVRLRIFKAGFVLGGSAGEETLVF
jgi:hypothetical protein